MKLAAFACALLLFLPILCPYSIPYTREELLDKYYKYSDKVPRSARLLLGDETINVHIGDSVIGIKTKNGELSALETYAFQRATITITVDAATASKLDRHETGIIKAIDEGGIRIKTSNLLSGFKVEALKKIYAVSGYDKQLYSQPSKGESQPDAYNSIYVQRASFQN